MCVVQYRRDTVLFLLTVKCLHECCDLTFRLDDLNKNGETTESSSFLDLLKSVCIHDV